MKCLFSKTPEEFIKFSSELVSNWYVRKDSIQDRYNALAYSKQRKVLNELAEKNNIKINSTEIVSWLDSMSQLYLIFDSIQSEIIEGKIKNDLFDNMFIIAEYHIPFNKNRIDYLIAKDNKILLIEFSYCDNEKSKDHYKRKLNQIIYYQDLLKSSLSDHIKVNIFAFLIKPETDENEFYTSIKTASKYASINVDPNYDERLFLIELIIHTFSNTKKTAIEELDSYGDMFLYD